MEIVDSLEVRWFLANDHPARQAASSWFDAIASEGARTDHYLLTGRDDLGFKARLVEKQPAKVETKYLLGSLGAVQLATSVVGKLERWRKLSLALDDPKLDSQGTWLALNKDRQLRKFAFDDGRGTEVPVSSRPDAGCGVELTRLLWKRGDFDTTEWSLGLEAFGPPDRLLEVMLATCRVAFAQLPTLALAAAHSDSYPGWLRALTATKSA
jgi:hypothetical protein